MSRCDCQALRSAVFLTYATTLRWGHGLYDLCSVPKAPKAVAKASKLYRQTLLIRFENTTFMKWPMIPSPIWAGNSFRVIFVIEMRAAQLIGHKMDFFPFCASGLNSWDRIAASFAYPAQLG